MDITVWLFMATIYMIPSTAVVSLILYSLSLITDSIHFSWLFVVIISLLISLFISWLGARE